MKILGGNQIIFYTNKEGSFEDQLGNCLEQLEDYMDQHQIYPGSLIRHNIYLDISEKSQYEKTKINLKTIAKRRFPLPIIINFIAQKPIQGNLALESTHIKSTQWNCVYKENKYGACQMIKKGNQEIVLGSVQVSKYSDIQENAEKAFEKMEALLSKCNLSTYNLVKQWNYIEHMLDKEFDTQRYQSFNDVRTQHYDTFFSETGYPASTEVSCLTGGIIIEFLAVKHRDSLSLPINNPSQKAAYQYSSKVLAKSRTNSNTTPTTPKLERARSLTIDNKTMLFISGTSSIIGERITAKGDAKEQTFVILENIKKLIAKKNIEEAGITCTEKSQFSLVKTYIQNEKDFERVNKILIDFFGDIPLLLVQTDLPRKGILVELEAELIL